MIRQSFFKPSRLLLAAAIVTATATGVVQAQELSSLGDYVRDPEEASQQALALANAGRNHFFINDNSDVEIIRFRSPRDVNICAGPANFWHHGQKRGFALNVNWDAQSAVVQPGSCFAFEAQKVRVSSASPLPATAVLEGTFQTTK